MHYKRRDPIILTQNAHQMRDDAIANAFASAWRGGKSVITRVAAFTVERLRAASTHIGRRLRHE